MSAEAAIAAIKALHTAVFLFASGCILYALYCGIAGRAARGPLLAAFAVPSAIGLFWWLNGHECLLSTLIYRLADGDRTRSDIFLPDWMAQHIMPVSAAMLAVAAALVLWRQLKSGWRSSRPG